MNPFQVTRPPEKRIGDCRSQLFRTSPRWVPVAFSTVLVLASLFHPRNLFVTSLSLARHSELSTKRRVRTQLWATELESNNAVTFNGGQNWIQTAIASAETTTAADKSTVKDIQTRFFLVNTKHPGNVGSSARSLKTMGFCPEGLVVVDPHDKRVLGRKKCIDASSGATDVLEHTLLVVDNENDETTGGLEQALRDAFGGEDVLVCGTGMPVDMAHERASRRYLEPRRFFESLLTEYHQQPKDSNAQSTLNIAFVFGNERYGMNPEDLDLCDVVLGIPTNPSFGSLNLATAVQIIAYDWRLALGGYDDV